MLTSYSFQKIVMATKHILLILPILLALTIHLLLTETFAQQGSMATLQNIDATYAVSIVPGAAQKENIYHYYPPQIAVPTNTTVGWFNNDFGQVLSLIPVLCQLQLTLSFNSHLHNLVNFYIIVLSIHGG